MYMYVWQPNTLWTQINLPPFCENETAVALHAVKFRIEVFGLYNYTTTAALIEMHFSSTGF